MSKNSCIAAEKHRRCVLRMARAELLLYDIKNQNNILEKNMRYCII